ncbi:hypothetical protein V6C27_05030 [Peptococcaceae bacterium 1198_IL3148]
MKKELNNSVDAGQCQARNSAVQGDSRAIATGDGAKAVVYQTIVQLFMLSPGYVGAVKVEDLGKLINVVLDKEGNLTINGVKVHTDAAENEAKMVVLCQRDIQQAEDSNVNVGDA